MIANITVDIDGSGGYYTWIWSLYANGIGPAGTGLGSLFRQIYSL